MTRLRSRTSHAVPSNTEWIRWGEDDPLWAVATENGRRRDESGAWTDEAFYSSGESDWRDFARHWQHYGVDSSSCVEVGCGAGRYTKYLAQTFRRVFALDVAPGMIFRARLALGTSNIGFILGSGADVPVAGGSVTAIFSTHVMQHLDDPECVVRYFREFYRVLDSGGTVMIHVPLYEWPGVGRIASLMGVFHSFLVLASNILARIKRRLGVNLMRGIACRSSWLRGQLIDIGFTNVEFGFFETSRLHAVHSFVFARKPSKTLPS
jgi:SAM-dependent methyltransferase